MPEQFLVDLRGIVNILSHHLYRSERVYLRELIQNAHDAIVARSHLGHRDAGRIEITPARGTASLVIRDNGIGLTDHDMRALLSMIGGTSKRDDFAVARRHFLGQFGIGMLSCFLVADSIEVISRSARDPDAPTLRWVGHSDGTFTVSDAPTPLPSPGTEVRLRPRHGAHRWCDSAACHRFAGDYAELLNLPVHVDGRVVSQHAAPWQLPLDQQLAWCREHFGFEAMGIIPLDEASGNVAGLAYVLPYTAGPGHRTGDRIYAKGMLVADTDNLIIPPWAFFCRAVIDVGDLPLTASREGLQESATLQFVRKRLGFQLLSELIIVQSLHPDVYRDILRLHADGLRALAIREPYVRDLLRSTLPYDTTRGPRTIKQLIDQNPRPVRYVSDADTYAALTEIAVHTGALLVNASGVNEAELLDCHSQRENAHFLRMTASDVAELVQITPYADTESSARLIATAQHVLREERLAIAIAEFEPFDRPILYWPLAPADSQGQIGNRSPQPGDNHRATFILNAGNPVIKRLLDVPPRTDLRDILRALYIAGLLLSRTQPTVSQANQLTSSVLQMADTTLSIRPASPVPSPTRRPDVDHPVQGGFEAGDAASTGRATVANEATSARS